MNTRWLKRLGFSFGLSAAVGMLMACTHSTSNSAPKIADILAQATGQDGRACIRTGNIRGYAANRGTITIDAGRQYYIATTLYRCNNLETAPAALFDSRYSEACGGSSYVITRGERCPINRIYKFESRKAALDTLTAAEEKQKEIANSTAE